MLADGALTVAVIEILSDTRLSARCMNSAKLGELRLAHLLDKE